MNISDFLQAAQGPKIGKKRVSPQAFLNHYREFLHSFPGIRSKIETVFRSIEKGTMWPTPALTFIMGLISTESEMKPRILPDPKTPKGSKEAKASDPKAPKALKPPKKTKEERKAERNADKYVIILSIKDGLGSWANGIWEGPTTMAPESEVRRVVDPGTGLPTWKEMPSNFFVIKGKYLDAERLADRKLAGREDSVYAEVIGFGTTTRIERRDAIARVYKKESGPATKRVAKISSSLRWGIRTKDYKQHFSGC